MTEADICAQTPHDVGGPCKGTSGGPLITIHNGKPMWVGVYARWTHEVCGAGLLMFSYAPSLSDFIAAHT